MLFIYFFIGFLASTLGALPLGASNIAVINTTLKQNVKQAFKIAVAASIGEVILSFYALHCNTVVQNFIDKNLWIQITIAILLLVIGSFLIFKKQSSASKKKTSLVNSKYATGLFLGLLNPPVLIFWIVAIGMINMHNYSLTFQSPLLVLVLFFVGVYLGKLFTLYTYSKFSVFVKSRSNNITLMVNKITGVLLILIGLVQTIRFL